MDEIAVRVQTRILRWGGKRVLRLQTYEQLFEGKTMTLLEPDSELLKYFRSPRGPGK
jgi:hypothetical protein